MSGSVSSPVNGSVANGSVTSGPVVRPYGDTTGDGMVQLSFTLPIPHDRRAEGAALQLAGRMGMDPAMVVHAKAMGPDFTFFVVYGRVSHLVDLDQVEVVERSFPCSARRRPTSPSAVACAAGWSWSVRASAPTRTPWVSTPS